MTLVFQERNRRGETVYQLDPAGKKNHLKYSTQRQYNVGEGRARKPKGALESVADGPGLGDWPGGLAAELNTEEAQPCQKHCPGCSDAGFLPPLLSLLPARCGGQGAGKQP